MELRLGHIDKSNSKSWTVSPQMGIQKLGRVGERLEMLKLLVEQRSEDDLKLVMTWLENQLWRKENKQVHENLLCRDCSTMIKG